MCGVNIAKAGEGRVEEGRCAMEKLLRNSNVTAGFAPVLRQVFRKPGGAKLHLGDTGMRGYDFPASVKF